MIKNWKRNSSCLRKDETGPDKHTGSGRDGQGSLRQADSFNAAPARCFPLWRGLASPGCLLVWWASLAFQSEKANIKDHRPESHSLQWAPTSQTPSIPPTHSNPSKSSQRPQSLQSCKSPRKRLRIGRPDMTLFDRWRKLSRGGCGGCDESGRFAWHQWPVIVRLCDGCDPGMAR